MIQLNLSLSANDSQAQLHSSPVRTLSVCLQMQQEHFPSDRTAVLPDVNPLLTHDNLAELFTPFGVVEETVLVDGDDNDIKDASKRIARNQEHYFPYRHRTGIVVFQDSSALDRLKNYDISQVQPHLSSCTAPVGLNKYIQEYNMIRPDTQALETSVTEFMKIFDDNERKEEERLKDGPIVDSEGFTLVQSKKKRKRVIPGSHKAPEKPKEQTVPLSFYRVSRKLEKQKELENLRKKFENDKKKIKLMRDKRKFNPYTMY